MGCFSWCYCDTGKIRMSHGEAKPRRDQRLVGYSHDHPASVLFPKEFGGKDAQIDIDVYPDYGRFGGMDIFELVADWNREWVAANPEWVPPYSIKYEKLCPECPAKPIGAYSWYPFFSNLKLSPKEVVSAWEKAVGKNGLEYRYIGIDIAGEDENNAAIRYPIKIARYPESIYEECPASLGDPHQGCD